MTLAKYAEVWNLLEKYEFKFEDEGNSGIICSICKSIMIDPYSASCGCQYCFQCIKSYVGNSKKLCPSGREECTEEFLELNVNILKNFRTSLAIINTDVKCPFEGCPFATKLSNMNEHVRVCTACSIECPYESIGCTDVGPGSSTLSGHQNEYSIRHSQLLVEAINHLRNDVNVLKQTGLEKEVEIVDLKKEVADNKEEIQNLTTDNQIKEILILDMKAEIKDIKAELNVLRQKVTSSENTKVSISDELKEKYKENATYVDNSITQLSKEIGKIKSRLTKVIPIINEDFFWKIDNFLNKEGYYYSEPFYKDNYKVRLGAKHGELYLTLYLHIVPGERDDDASWPMKYDVTMSVIGNGTLAMFEHWKCQYLSYSGDKSMFDRQTSDTNKGIFVGYISIDEISVLIQGSSSNNCILISCTLSPATAPRESD